MRVTVLPPWPMTNMAFSCAGWLAVGSLVGSQHRVEPAGGGDAGRLHQRLAERSGRLQPVVVDLPDPAPMPPGIFVQAVIAGQRRDIEAHIGRALHVGMAAEDVGAGAGDADIAGRQQQDAIGPHIGGADRLLRRAHAPDQRRRLLRGEDLRHALQLLPRHAGDALDLLRRPLGDLAPDLLHAVDALADEFLVLPAILEDVPEHAPDHRDVGARADADIFGRMRRGAGEARVDDEHVRPVQLLARQHVLERDRMRLRRVAAHDDHGLGVADVVVAVGLRAIAQGVGDAGDGGGVADAGLVVDVVGAPEGARTCGTDRRPRW